MRWPQSIVSFVATGKPPRDYAAASISAATRRPERIAPSIYPFHASAVPAPARWIRSIGARDAAPYIDKTPGVMKPA